MTQQNNADVTARAEEYAARVAAALSDLPAEQAAVLTDGLPEHLLEPGDDGVPLLDQQGSPEQYAAELRATLTDNAAAPTTVSGSESRGPTSRLILAALALALAVVLVAVAVVLIAPRLRGTETSPAPTPTPAVSPSTVAVPDLVGMSRGEAENAIAMAGFRLGTVTTTPAAASVPAGYVVAMSPAAGANAATGSPIDLTVAK